MRASLGRGHRSAYPTGSVRSSGRSRSRRAVPWRQWSCPNAADRRRAGGAGRPVRARRRDRAPRARLPRRPRRRCAKRPCRWRRWRGRGARPSCRGSARRCRRRSWRCSRPARSRRRRSCGEVPAGLIEITRLPGIGAKRARLLHSELGIDSPQALREAARGAARCATVKGLGPKFEEGVLAALDRAAETRRERRCASPSAAAAGARARRGARRAAERSAGGRGTRS